MSIGEQSLFLLIALVYFGAWWRALRLVFGDLFVPLEWIPILVCAVCVPAGLKEWLYFSSWRGSEAWFILPWACMPVPLVIGSFLKGRLWTKIANENHVECNPPPDDNRH
jgi:hypothetical protein